MSGARPLVLVLGLALIAVLGCAHPGMRSTGGLLEQRGPAPPKQLSESPAAALAPVESLTAVSGELRRVPLHWEAVLTGPVAGYAIERSPSAEGPFQRVGRVEGRFRTAWQDGAVEEGAADAGSLEDAASFHYRVRAFDPQGRLAPAAGAVAEATTAPVPGAPSGFRAYSQLPRKVALAWDPSADPGVRGYVVSRSPAARGGFRPVARLEGRFATTWVDAGLGDLRVFYYRVSAVNAAGGVGEPTTPARAVTKPEPLPPLELTVGEQTLGRNALHWKPNVEPDVVRYRVFRRRSGSASEEPVAVVEAGETRALDREVGANEPVYYSAEAEDSDGLVSGRSDELAVVSQGYGLVASAEAGHLELRWSEEVQAGLAATRVLELGPLGEREISRTSEARFRIAVPEGDGAKRYRLVGIRPDGSEAPPSGIVEFQPTPGAAGAR